MQLNVHQHNTHLEHTWAYAQIRSTKQPSMSSTDVQANSAHSSGPPSDGTFKRKGTTDLSALTQSLRLSVSHYLFCTEIRRCNDARAFFDKAWVNKSIYQCLFLPELVKKRSRDRERRGESIGMRIYLIKANALNPSSRERSLSADGDPCC